MKMKKVICFLLVFFFAFCNNLDFAFADVSNRFYFTNLSVNEGNISVKAKYSGTDTATAMLVVIFVEDITGKVLASDSDITQELADSEEDILSAELSYTGDKSGSYRYFLWDSIQGHTPLENTAPMNVDNVELEESKTNSVKLTWDEADDDYRSVEKYNVYDNGKFIGSTTECTITDTMLDIGQQNNYEIYAEDTEGAESTVTEFVASAKKLPEVITSGDNIIQDYEGSVYFINEESTLKYGYTEPYVNPSDNRECRITTKQIRESDGRVLVGQIPFGFSDAYLEKIKDIRAISFEITYFDENLGNLRIYYDKGGTNLGGNKIIAQTGETNTWKSVRIDLTDAEFAKSTNRGNSYANFRIATDVEGLKLYSVRVAPTSEFTTDSASVIVTDAVTTRKMKFFEGESADGNIESTTLDGVNTLYAPNGGYYEFNTEDTFITPSTRKFFVDVEYFDDSDDVLVFEYIGWYGRGIQTVEREMTKTGKWRKIRFETFKDGNYNANSDGTIEGGVLENVDFRISTKNNSPLYIKSVRAINPGQQG